MAYATRLVLPEEIEGKPVIGVLDSYTVFSDSDNLRYVSFPGSLGEVGLSTFQETRSLRSVTLEPGITAIGESAFQDRKLLAEVILPDTLTHYTGQQSILTILRLYRFVTEN